MNFHILLEDDEEPTEFDNLRWNLQLVLNLARESHDPENIDQTNALSLIEAMIQGISA